MLDKLFGIIKRAWYLFFAIISFMAVTGLLFELRFDPEKLIMAFALPFAWVIHRTAHWIIWGKIK